MLTSMEKLKNYVSDVMADAVENNDFSSAICKLEMLEEDSGTLKSAIQESLIYVFCLVEEGKPTVKNFAFPMNAQKEEIIDKLCADLAYMFEEEPKEEWDSFIEDLNSIESMWGSIYLPKAGELMLEVWPCDKLYENCGRNLYDFAPQLCLSA